MGMTDSHGQGVGRVLGGHGIQLEQGSDHVLHLPLFSLAVAGHRLLDFTGGVIEDSQVIVQSGHHSGPPGMAELEGRTWVAGKKHVFDRGDLGPVGAYHLAQVLEYGEQPPRKDGISSRADGAAGHKSDLMAMGRDHAIPGDP